jgi:replicative DNA helicase
MEEQKTSEKKEILNNAYLSAQENLVSSLMVLPNRIIDVMSMIEDDDFDNISCKYIYHAMSQLVKNGISDDMTPGILQSELEKEGHLTTIGGQRKLVSLLESGYMSASSSTVDTYARTVKDISAKNQTTRIIDDMKSDLLPDSGQSARDVLEDAQHNLSGVMGNLENVNTTSTMADYFSTFVDNIKERRKIFDDTGDILAASGGIPTGFPTLNKLLSGWHKGNMITIGAKTGIGKTVSAINFALAAAQSGASVLFFSLEMTIEEIMTRFVSCYTGIYIKKIKDGNLTDDEMDKIEHAHEMINMKIKIDTSQKATVDYIMSSAQKMAQSEDGLDLIIIDYLGLIKYKGNFSSDRQNQVADISRSLKETSMDLQIPIIVLVQINSRGTNEEMDAEPSMGLIRESGSIAQDSNVVILIHRKKGEEGERRYDQPTKFTVVKNRNGDIGSFLCHSWLWKSKFDEILEDGENDEFDDDGLDAGNDAAPNDTHEDASIHQSTADISKDATPHEFKSVDFNDDDDDMDRLFG